MTTQKHTPEPWYAFINPKHGHAIYAGIQKTITICRSHRTSEQSAADMILCSSSPDLLKACKAALAALSTFDDCVDIATSDSGDTVFGQSIDKAAVEKAIPLLTAAIAKAEGK